MNLQVPKAISSGALLPSRLDSGSGGGGVCLEGVLAVVQPKTVSVRMNSSGFWGWSRGLFFSLQTP